MLGVFGLLAPTLSPDRRPARRNASLDIDEVFQCDGYAMKATDGVPGLPGLVRRFRRFVGFLVIDFHKGVKPSVLLFDLRQITGDHIDGSHFSTSQFRQ